MNAANTSITFSSIDFTDDSLPIPLFRKTAEYRFVNCTIKRLSRLHGPADITRFEIIDSTIHKIEPSIFSSIYSVKVVNLINVNLPNMNGSFFRQLVNTLVHCIISWFPEDLALNDVFVLDSKFRLEYLTIHSRSPKFRVLAAENFTSLVCLQILDLSHCGIEVIEPGAFQLISKNLIQLDLRGNKINSFSYPVFFDYMDGRKAMQIDFRENPIKCDCSFYAMQSVAAWDAHQNHDHSSLILNYDHRQDQAVARENCSNLKSIQPTKMCMPHLETSQFYPTFRIKINETTETITIQSNTEFGFRLWIHNSQDLDKYNLRWNYATGRCPRRGFLKNSVQCVSIPKSGLEVALPASELSQICVIYVSREPKRIWPLNCIVHRRPISGSGCVGWLTIALFGGVGFIVATVALVIIDWKLTAVNIKEVEGSDEECNAYDYITVPVDGKSVNEDETNHTTSIQDRVDI